MQEIEATMELWLPEYLFVNYQDQAKFRLENTFGMSLRDLTVEVESPLLGEKAVAEKRLLSAQGGVWEASLQLSPTAEGRRDFIVRLRFRAFSMIEWTFEHRMLRMVRQQPRTAQEVHMVINQGMDRGAKEGMGQAVAGDYQVGHSVNVEGLRQESVESILDGRAREAIMVPVQLIKDRDRASAFANSLGMEFVAVGKGGYTQGSPFAESGRDPKSELQRDVMFETPFWVGRYEVTQAEWAEIMDTPATRYEEVAGDRMPANGMSWSEAVEYCRLLTERDTMHRRLPDFLEYRLPTEAEWEYVCRAGSTESRYGELEEIAVTSKSQSGMQVVGQREPNEWGLYDTLGNVFEWCLDTFQDVYPSDQFEHPVHCGEPGDPKVLRGGCFQNGPDYARAAARCAAGPDTQSGRIGFRVVAAFKEKETQP